MSQRMTVLMALTVMAAVVLVSVGAYLVTRWSLFNQLDKELTDVAGYMSTALGSDSENLAGMNAEALRAANTTLLLVRSDGQVLRVPGDSVILVTGDDELAVARTGFGSSARTGQTTEGVSYRLVSVPKQIGPANYALVLGRPIAATTATLALLLRTLGVIGVAGLLLATLSGWLTGRYIIRPVRTLSEAVVTITETDELQPIAVTASDEVGDLTRSFNTMLMSLASSRERQKRLIADAGHELRTPLTSMRTNIELLVADDKTGMLPPGARGEILRDVSAQLTEFTSLVGDLVQLSREDAVRANPEPIDFSEVVDAAVTRARRRGPNLKFDVQLEPLTIMGEPGTLERAITNLLDNAVKFSPPGGTIHVVMDGELLRISDQGPGIAEEDLPHVFDRFYRSDRARNTPGTGLGLSIVAHTINGHGGWVRAGRSAEGGAEFTVRLPAVRQDESTEDAEDAV